MERAPRSRNAMRGALPARVRLADGRFSHNLDPKQTSLRERLHPTGRQRREMVAYGTASEAS